jgi:hypothetical protein
MAHKLARVAEHLRTGSVAAPVTEPCAAAAGGLEDLSGFLQQVAPGDLTVPEWQVGCWKREIITFSEHMYQGKRFPLRDDTTFVVWLQTSSRCADIRIPVAHLGHPEADREERCPSSLKNATLDELLVLAEADGWTGRCRAAGSQPISMGAPASALTAVNDWYNDDWSAGLPTDQKFPELGEMRRVGNSCLEFAPSGAYVEDWRLQPGSAGISASLVLLAEDGQTPSGVVQFVCSGNHACFTRGRPEGEIDMDAYDGRPLPEHLGELLASGRRAEAERLLNMESSYAVRANGAIATPYVIEASTFPWLVGTPMPTVRTASTLQPDRTAEVSTTF